VRVRRGAALLPLLLAGCGSVQSAGDSAPAPSSPALSSPVSASPVPSSPVPTASPAPSPSPVVPSVPPAPSVPGGPGTSCGQKGPCDDPDVELPEPAATDEAAAQEAVPRARQALEPLLAGSPGTAGQVVDALVEAGFPRERVTAVGNGLGVAVGGVQVSIAFRSACLDGEVTTQQVTLAVVGAGRDFSCVPSGSR